MAKFRQSRSSRRFYQAPKTTAVDSTVFEVQITGLSHDGRGLARPKGKTLFVEGALPGERVEVQRTQSKRNFDQAKALRIIESSAERVEPPCSHFGRCGGCQLQHLQPAAQIQAKQQQALDQLRRIGGTEPIQLLPPLDGPHWGYRRRARLGITRNQDGQLAVGFRQQASKQLCAIDNCAVLDERAQRLIDDLNPLLNRLEQPQSISHLELALGDTQSALLLRHPKPLPVADIQALQQLAEQHHFALYLQPAGRDSLVCAATPSPALSYTLLDGALKLQFEPQDFTQINADINQQLVELALELLQPQAGDRILDLFCGLGNFTLPLAYRGAEVVGVEAIDTMVQRGRQNAALNRLERVQFHAADLTQPVAKLPWYGSGFNKVLLDPPRAGAAEVIPALAKLHPERILYISCDPATLARDAGLLKQHGYRLKQWGVLNMFPHTSHLESIACFER